MQRYIHRCCSIKVVLMNNQKKDGEFKSGNKIVEIKIINMSLTWDKEKKYESLTEIRPGLDLNTRWAFFPLSCENPLTARPFW